MREERSPWCPRCKRLAVSGHRCPPEWLVCEAEPTRDEQPASIFAGSAREAAEQWPEHERDAVELLARGSTIDLLVRRAGSKVVHQLTIAGALKPSVVAHPTPDRRAFDE